MPRRMWTGSRGGFWGSSRANPSSVTPVGPVAAASSAHRTPAPRSGCSGDRADERRRRCVRCRRRDRGRYRGRVRRRIGRRVASRLSHRLMIRDSIQDRRLASPSPHLRRSESAPPSPCVPSRCRPSAPPPAPTAPHRPHTPPARSCRRGCSDAEWLREMLRSGTHSAAPVPISNNLACWRCRVVYYWTKE